ncbi:ribose transport system permease protein [Kibdelosporangium banguiense]|uniref:Ribose transport system permease protein n=1 Tax=Kibdelosporangium banguiense TaxID=1365924 RepID=A0ABS4TTG0_9PSEU|nr:ABC transporter permease [Kibdelosporangium banguiense]MBP2327696.1 ribose transport system permease protein [Kibdelosporangium banguiense]
MTVVRPEVPVAIEGTADSGVTRREQLAGLVQRRGSVVVLALVVLISAFAFDSFATVDNARNIAMQSSFLAIIALGMTFVIISGGIDLSVGSVYALGGVLAAYGVQWGSLAGLLLPLVVCGGVGLLNGALVAYGRLAPFIVTLATLLGARGLLLAITDEGATTRLMPQDAVLTKAGQGTFLGLGIPVWIVIALFAVGVLVLQRTRFGHSVLAIGGSAEAARLMGLPVARRTMGLYAGSGLLAGLAGALSAAYYASGVTIVGVGMELDAIAAVVIGGTLLTGGAGTVGGTLAGVLLLMVIQNVINQIGTLSSHYQSVVSGVFLAIVVAVQAYLSRAHLGKSRS